MVRRRMLPSLSAGPQQAHCSLYRRPPPSRPQILCVDTKIAEGDSVSPWLRLLAPASSQSMDFRTAGSDSLGLSYWAEPNL